MIRVYLDTNILDTYFRENPAAYSACKAAKKSGYVFSSGVEVAQEIMNNRDNLEEARRSFRRLIELTSPHLMSRERKALVHIELKKHGPLTDTEAYFSATTNRQTLEDLWKNFDSASMDDLCRAYSLETKQQFKSARERHRPYIDLFSKDRSLTELSFSEFWSRFLGMDTFPDIVKAMAEKSFPPPDIAMCRNRIETMRAFKTALVINAAQIYIQVHPDHRAKPHKNDSMDMGHSIVGSYSDIFVTNDAPFFKTLILARSELPYKVMLPGDFLASAAGTSA